MGPVALALVGGSGEVVSLRLADFGRQRRRILERRPNLQPRRLLRTESNQ